MNKKEYDLQIWQYNMHYINIIVMKDVIILKKTKEKIKLSESITDITMSVEMA